MSEQIILEFIGDPSGLKPAEDALKNLSKTSQETVEAFNKANEAAKKFAEGTKETAKSLDELEQQSAKTAKSLSALSTAIAVGAITAITSEFLSLASGIAKASDKAAEGKEKHAAFSREAKALQLAITELDKSLNDNTNKLNGHSTAASKGLKAMSEMADGSKKLVSAMGSVGSEIAHLTGNEEKANEIRERASEVLGVLSAAQTVATTAQWALNVAMDANPIGVVIVAITALIAAYEIFGKDTEGNTDKLKEQNAQLEKISKSYQDLSDANKENRNLAMEDIKLDQEKSQIKNESLTKQKELIDNANNAQKDYLSSERTNINILNDGLSKLNIGIDKLEIGTQSINGHTAIDNYRVAFKNASDAADKLISKINEIGEDESRKKEKESLQTSLNTVIQYKNHIHDVDVGFKALGIKEMKDDLDYQKRTTDKGLQDIKAMWDARVLLAAKGSAKERDAKKEDLKAQFNIDNSNPELGDEKSQQRLRLQAQLTKDIEAIDDQYRNESRNKQIEKLNQDKELLNLQLEFLQADDDKRLEYTKKMIDDERLLKIKAAKGNKDLIAAIENEATNKTSQAQTDHDQAVVQKQLHIQQNNLKAQLALVEANSQAELDIKLNQANVQEALDKSIAEATIHDTQLKESKITDIIASAIKTRNQIKNANIDNQYKGAGTAATQHTDKIDSMQSKAQVEAAKNGEELTFEMKISFLQKYHDAYKVALYDLEKLHKDNQNKYKDNLEQKKKDDEDYAKSKADLEKKIDQNEISGAKLVNEQKKKLSQEQVGYLKQAAAAAIQIVQQVADFEFADAKQKRDNELSDHMDHLNVMKDAELSNKSLTNSQKKAIEEKYRREEAAAKLQAWKADQKSKEIQAIINGFLAFTSSLAQQGFPAGLITGAIALAMSGVQAGLIASQTPPKFAKGVVALNGPGTDTSDSIPAYLSKGESVITAKATKKYAPMLEAMNAGIFDKLYAPQLADLSSLLQNTGVHISGQTIDYERLGKVVAKNIPAPVTNNIRMDEKGFSKYITKGGNKMEYLNGDVAL